MIRNRFLQSTAFSFQNNIFYQQDLPRTREFETLYLSIREKENRLYPDEVVRILPEILPQHSQRSEWMRRKFSFNKIARYVQQKKAAKILEVGCGNGWLCRHLSSVPGSEVVGIDVNETELLQGARVFADIKNLFFVYADVGTAILPFRQFDYIIFSASIQYFGNIDFVLEKLLSSLGGGGEIHIFDSPIYREENAASARRRSQDYFSSAGVPMMAQSYHHHTWKKFAPFKPVVLYNPESFLNRLRQKFSEAPPFPWLKITDKGKSSS
jgi:SAM-dependent methyltransferase